ncbi:DUF4391 domain-containing protein [Zobellella sp. DQSA1]|uniref:DUF4391 domain-containing protein n=1 Tax=Zobellella sp. DQSA1 TaxID=3342386 RepID=UPI0035C09E77
MTQALSSCGWLFPPQTRFDKVIPKSKFYQQAAIGGALQVRFVEELEQIIWACKLAPDTVNLPATEAVTEIQVFTLKLKGETLSEEVVAAIDKAIPFPIIFALQRTLGEDRQQLRYLAAYKRKSAADAASWVRSEYLDSGWIPATAPRSALPAAINMERLYQALLASLLPITTWAGESMDEAMARLGRLRKLNKQIAALRKKIGTEKQFKRKVELHRELKALQQEQSTLSQTERPAAPSGQNHR